MDEFKDTITENGYKYTLDEEGRVEKVEGDLGLLLEERDQKAQLDSGGEARRDTDEGGHFIGARFNGPADEINLFPQNENFNRGAYKSWENRWASELEQGNSVSVEIQPVYEDDTKRPTAIMAEAKITDADGKERVEYYSGVNENIRSSEFDLPDEDEVVDLDAYLTMMREQDE